MTGQPAALPRHFISSAYVPCVLKPGPKLPCASCYLKIGFTIVTTSWGVRQSRWTGLMHQSVARRDWHTVPLLPCYCISIITIIKVRRSKLAIQRKWHEVLGASLPILQAVPLSLKKKKMHTFFFTADKWAVWQLSQRRHPCLSHWRVSYPLWASVSPSVKWGAGGKLDDLRKSFSIPECYHLTTPVYSNVIL